MPRGGPGPGPPAAPGGAGARRGGGGGGGAGARPLRSREPLGEVLARAGIAVLDRRVRRVEELEEVVRDPRRLELAAERLGAEVEEELVARAAAYVDRAQRAQRVAALARHAHRVPGEPALPDLRPQLAGR